VRQRRRRADQIFRARAIDGPAIAATRRANRRERILIEPRRPLRGIPGIIYRRRASSIGAPSAAACIRQTIPHRLHHLARLAPLRFDLARASRPRFRGNTKASKTRRGWRGSANACIRQRPSLGCRLCGPPGLGVKCTSAWLFALLYYCPPLRRPFAHVGIDFQLLLTVGKR
jgi:hypothetical protein